MNLFEWCEKNVIIEGEIMRMLLNISKIIEKWTSFLLIKCVINKEDGSCCQSSLFAKL